MGRFDINWSKLDTSEKLLVARALEPLRADTHTRLEDDGYVLTITLREGVTMAQTRTALAGKLGVEDVKDAFHHYPFSAALYGE